MALFASTILNTRQQRKDAKAEKSIPMPDSAMGKANFSPDNNCLFRMMRSEETDIHARTNTLERIRRCISVREAKRGGFSMRAGGADAGVAKA